MDSRRTLAGRPRSTKAHAAILHAAIAVIRDVGYDAAGMELIAARAGVGKATIYRRWACKESLVAEALEHLVLRFSAPDTGTTRDDLRAVIRQSMGMYQDPATSALLSGLVAAMARSESIADAVRNGFIAARRDQMRRVLRRGIERDDLDRDLDEDLALDFLSGPLTYRGLISGAAIDEHFVHAVVDAAMRAFAPAHS